MILPYRHFNLIQFPILMNAPYPNLPQLVLPDNHILITQLKVKLAIYQRRLSMLNRYYQHNPNNPICKPEVIGAWYVVKILEQLLMVGKVEPRHFLNHLTDRQLTEGYGKKTYPKAFAAWMHILHQYVTYRKPIPLPTSRLK